MSDLVLRDSVPEDFWNKAQTELTIPQFNLTKEYIESGKHPLAPDTVASLFQLYLNGSSFEEIHRLNRVYPLASICWAAVKYDWETQKIQYIRELQANIRDKVIKAQLETTELLSTMLSAANKKNADPLRKYLQTGDATELKDSLNIQNLTQLLKIVEGLQKLVQPGESTQQKAVVDINISNGNSTVTAPSDEQARNESVDPSIAAQALALLTKKKSV